MKTAFLGLLPFVFAFASYLAGAEAPPRLSPHGLPGTVLLVGEKFPPAGPVEALVKFSDNKPSLVVVEFGQASDAVDEALRKSGHATYTRWVLSDAALPPQAKEALETARCVWIHGTLSGDAKTFQPLMHALVSARERGAAIAISGELAKRAGEAEILPGIVWSASPVESKVAIAWHDEAVLLVRGRDVANLGSSPIDLKLAKSATRDERTIALQPRHAVDYNELRRAAWGRTQAAYPPQEPGKPEVAKGALVIIGGGGMPREIAERFVQLGGGAEGKFVVLPTAMPDPLPADQASFLKRFGAKNIAVLETRDQAELEKPETLKLFEEATAVWFGGGRQWRFVDAYEGTKVYAALHKVLERGGVIGGSSAGATIQGEYLVRGAPAGPHIMMCEGYERGFCFLPGVAIDQHFAQRKRFADMTALMKVYPQYLGIGLDEATAIVVQGSVAEVMGPGKVHIYDGRKNIEEGKPDYEDFSAGQKIDLVERKLVE